MYFTLNSVDIKIILQVYCYDFYIYPGKNIEENISMYTYILYECIFKTKTNFSVELIASR